MCHRARRGDRGRAARRPGYARCGSGSGCCGSCQGWCVVRGRRGTRARCLRGRWRGRRRSCRRARSRTRCRPPDRCVPRSDRSGPTCARRLGRLPRHALEQGRLPGPVGPDDRDHLAALGPQRHAIEHRAPAERRRNRLCLEHHARRSTRAARARALVGRGTRHWRDAAPGRDRFAQSSPPDAAWRVACSRRRA